MKTYINMKSCFDQVYHYLLYKRELYNWNVTHVVYTWFSIVGS